MIRRLTLASLLTTCAGLAFAQPAPRADCSTYRRGSDGSWISTIRAKVGNPKDFKILEPGLPVPKDMMVAGINVSDTLDKLCGQ